MIKPKTIYIDVYDFKIFYLVSNYKICRKILKEKFNIKTNANYKGSGYSTGLYNDDGVYSYFIWVSKDADESVISHEAFHAAVFIMQDFAECKLTDESEEAYAYLLGFLIKQMLNYERPIKKIKRRK